MPEHRGPCPEAGPPLDLLLESDADPAKAGMTELVELARGQLHRALLRDGAFGGHDNREVATTLVAPADVPARLVDVERDLRDQGHGRAAGDARMQCDPPRVATHHLDDQDPVVTLGGGMETVDRLGRDAQRGVEAERHVGGPEVVVDRLRYADDVHALAVQSVGDTEGVLTPDRDQTVKVVAGQRLAHLLRTVVPLVRVRTRAPEDRPSTRQDPAR